MVVTALLHGHMFLRWLRLSCIVALQKYSLLRSLLVNERVLQQGEHFKGPNCQLCEFQCQAYHAADCAYYS